MFIQYLYKIKFKGGVEYKFATSDAHAREVFHNFNKAKIVSVEVVK